MKKNKKRIIAVAVIAIVIILAVITIFYLSRDENKLNIIEKQWINNNSKIVQNIGVKNNSNIFGKDGSGVFFDFIEDFSDEYDLTINPATYTTSKPEDLIYFRLTSQLDEKDLVLYQDHYVVLGKKDISLASINDLSNCKIGILSSQVSIVSEYLDNINNLQFTQYDSKEKLINEFDEQDNINYIIVPLNEYLDIILDESNYINLHLSDIPIYYTLYISGDNSELNSILQKYYNIWMENNFIERYNNQSFNFFKEALDISEEENDQLHNKTYNYGFVENNPYEAYASGDYGGIVGQYLHKFADFSKIDVNYEKYKSIKSLTNATNKKEIDLYFNTNSINSDYKDINTLLNIKYYVVAYDENNIALTSLKGLVNNTVYVLENSLLSNYLQSLEYLDVKTYTTDRELKKLVKDNSIIIIDQNKYNYLKSSVFKNYTIRYESAIDTVYTFRSNATDTFNLLFRKYVNTLDPQIQINEGVYSNRLIVKSGTILGTIARYILAVIFALVIIFIILFRSSKKIKIAKRIKKEDKMRFIDQLTSLKNRNYLNENIDTWNKNTIYPQTTLVIDVNNIQYINDTYGYEQGDLQIQAAANVLIKLQLDNTDIMRTDGTEFLVYFVGYKEKQIASFIRKLNKEFKKLPYDYGVIMAYSTINDDIKLIEDAINEATQEIREKKNKKESEIDEEKI